MILPSLRAELEAAGAKVSVESGASGEGLRAFPPSVAALARASAAVRRLELPLRVRGNGDSPWGPPAGGVLFDLGSLDRISSVDAETGIARVEAGCSVASLESAVRRVSATLGPLLPSVRSGSVGAWLAGPTRGERGVPGARRETAALSVAAVLADGRLAESRAAPRSATGPDLDHLSLGGEGRLSVIAAAWVRLLPASPAPVLSWRAADLAEAMAAVQRLCLDRLAPARAHLARSGGAVRAAAAWEGLSSAERERDRAGRALVASGAATLADGAGWYEFARAPAVADPVDVDASWAALGALVRACPADADVQLIGLHAGGSFASLRLAPTADETAQAAARAGARVLAPQRLRGAGRGWAEMGAGPAWDRLREALRAREDT